MASYSVTKSHIPCVPDLVTLISFDPNAEINAADNTWEWLGRASGAYTFPADVLVSANFEHRSGNPQARTVSFRGRQRIPSITLRVEPIGTIRLPNLNLLDVRAEKSFRLRPGHRMALQLNLYNVLNINSVTNWVVLSGPNFLRLTAIAPPRIAELAMSYRF